MSVVILLLPTSFASATTSSSFVSVPSSITSNFNSQSIAAGDVIWFASVVQWVGTSPTVVTHVHFIHQKLTITEPNGTTLTRSVPSGRVEFNPTATSATTTWGTPFFPWETKVPIGYKGDVFLSGFAFFVPAGGLPGGTVVNWSGTFVSDLELLPVKCLDFNWKWSAAVYSNFTHSNSAIGVKPVDDNHLSAYLNSDHAGTPENFKLYLVAGARGGGGSNYTGSYSGTQGRDVCAS